MGSFESTTEQPSDKPEARAESDLAGAPQVFANGAPVPLPLAVSIYLANLDDIDIDVQANSSRHRATDLAENAFRVPI